MLSSWELSWSLLGPPEGSAQLPGFRHGSLRLNWEVPGEAAWAKIPGTLATFPSPLSLSSSVREPAGQEPQS